eukprot:gene14275-20249_t
MVGSDASLPSGGQAAKNKSTGKTAAGTSDVKQACDTAPTSELPSSQAGPDLSHYPAAAASPGQSQAGPDLSHDPAAAASPGQSQAGPDLSHDPAAAASPGQSQSADVIDIVTPESTRCKCFTKNYTQYTKGTGSMVAHAWAADAPPPQSLSSEAAAVGPQGLGTVPAVERDKAAVVSKWKEDGVKLRYFTPKGPVTLPPVERDKDAVVSKWKEDGVKLHYFTPKGLGTLPTVERDKDAVVSKWREDGVKLHYFTLKEVANLHSFPSSFYFPANVTLRQRYQLLGNSLSVAVVADLIKYLLMEGLHVGP